MSEITSPHRLEHATIGAGRQHAAVGEESRAALGRIGLKENQIRLVQVPLEAITADHLPCLLVLSGGKALAVTGLPGDGNLEADHAGSRLTLPMDDVRSTYTGTIVTRILPSAEVAEGRGFIRPSLWNIAIATMKTARMFELIVIACLSNLFLFALPLFSMAIYDRIIPHKAYETLWALATGILIILIVDFVGRMLRNKMQDAAAHALGAKLQMLLFGKVLATDLEHAPKSAGGISGALSTIDAVCHTMPTVLVGLLVDLPFVIMLFIYIGIAAHWVVAVPVVSVLIIVVSNTVLHFMARKAHAETVAQSVARNSLIEESVSAFSVTKVTNGQDLAFRTLWRLITESNRSGDATRNAAAMAGLISSTVIQLNTVFALVVGVFAINDGGMTVGALVSAVMLSSRGISPLIGLTAALVRIASLAEPLRMVEGFMGLPAEVQGDGGRNVERLQGRIDASNVTFRYAGASAPAISDVNLSIRAGERVGIIGSIGSGKSTFLKMLPRLHIPETGGILVDGHDVRQYNPEFLRQQVAYMPQDCDLFDSTIRDNIVRGLEFVDEEAFAMAVEVSGIRDIAARQPSGYDLQVGKFGRRLSGGERQAACLARALVRPAAVLVLDEPTSAMDSQMERLIIDRLATVLDGRTLIVATHRAPLLSLVNRVIWFEQGKIIADGPPGEVVARASKAA